MIPKTTNRVRRQERSKQQGFTLIELLLSLSLLVLLTTFLSVGLTMGRHALVIDRAAARAAELDAAAHVLSDQIAAAFPMLDTKSGKLQFDGRQDAIGFTELSEGRASRAGLQRTTIQKKGHELVVDIAPAAQDLVQAIKPTRVVLLNDVVSFELRYFGRAGWQPQWTNSDRLPELVSVEIRSAASANRPATFVIALPQRP